MTKGELLRLAQGCDQPLGIPILDAMVDKYADKPYYHRLLYKIGRHMTEEAVRAVHPLYVELGVLYGDSAAHFIAGCRPTPRRLVAYGVDHTFQMHEPTLSDNDFIFIKGDSRDFRIASLFQDRSIDVLFIDTHHKYEVMYEELKLWVPKMVDDGVILADDVCSPLESCCVLFDKLPCDKIKVPELHLGGWGFGALFPPFDNILEDLSPTL